MKAVDAVIEQRLASDVPLVGQVARHLIHSGGKRLRPALLLLMCGALGCTDARRFNLAAVIEFIHTATLLHDDVVDDSSLRRGRATANHAFGNAASVLVGDFLYSRAFQMMVDAGDMRVMQILSDATNTIAEGEVQQLMNMHDAALGEAAYLRVIRAKTAKLFEASSRLAAVLAGAPAMLEQACADYGEALGNAFQIIDDLLDYEGDASEMGKNLGDDLREGKVTLPLIHALTRCSAAEHDLITQAIESGGSDAMAEIMRIVRSTGALETARATAEREAARAQDAISSLPDSEYRQALLELTVQSLARRT